MPIQFWLIRRKTEPNNADRWSTFTDESNARACLAEAQRLGDLWECVPAALTVPATEQERGYGTCDGEEGSHDR